MAEVVRKLKIHRRLASSACSWCGDALCLGEDGAVCEACETPHHARCWDKEDGCAETACVNAPLHQDTTPFVFDEQVLAEETRCSDCGRLLTVGTTACPDCDQFVIPGVFPYGIRETDAEALQALVLSIILVFVVPSASLLLFSYYQSAIWSLLPLAIGVRFGIDVFSKAGLARTRIAGDQTLTGNGLAVTAQILGIGSIALTTLATVGAFGLELKGL